MHRGRIGCRRWALSLAVGSVVACATMAATASSALAGGVSVKHSYTVNISPASVPAGKSTTLDVALANTSSPGGSLSSAELLPPLGFRVVHASLPSGASGHVHVILNIVVLDHLSVAPRSTLHLSVTVAAPPKCHTFFKRWLSDANTGGLFSEDLRLDLAHSSLTTDVTCVTATGLKFDTQPNDTVVSDKITGNQYDTRRTARDCRHRRQRRQSGRFLGARDDRARQQPRRRDARRHADPERRPRRRHIQRPDTRQARQRLHADGIELGADERHVERVQREQHRCERARPRPTCSQTPQQRRTRASRWTSGPARRMPSSRSR